MKRHLIACALAVASAFAAAQTSQPDDTLYRALGEKPGLTRLMDDFVPRLFTDPRMQPFFEGVKQEQLKQQLIDQLCQVSGGPCVYKGADMRSAHGNMEITKADFNALVEVLQEAMAAQRIDFRIQNRLLARLAPMHRDIVNTP
nr:group 1 truncated hemoglobin [uncultured Caldimonas sp.]